MSSARDDDGKEAALGARRGLSATNSLMEHRCENSHSSACKKRHGSNPEGATAARKTTRETERGRRKDIAEVAFSFRI